MLSRQFKSLGTLPRQLGLEHFLAICPLGCTLTARGFYCPLHFPDNFLETSLFLKTIRAAKWTGTWTVWAQMVPSVTSFIHLRKMKNAIPNRGGVFSFPISQSLSGSPCVNKYPQCPFQSARTNTMFQAGHPVTLKSSGVNRRRRGRCSTRYWRTAWLTFARYPRETIARRLVSILRCRNPIWTPDVPRVTLFLGPIDLAASPAVWTASVAFRSQYWDVTPRRLLLLSCDKRRGSHFTRMEVMCGCKTDVRKHGWNLDFPCRNSWDVSYQFYLVVYWFIDSFTRFERGRNSSPKTPQLQRLPKHPTHPHAHNNNNNPVYRTLPEARLTFLNGRGGANFYLAAPHTLHFEATHHLYLASVVCWSNVTVSMGHKALSQRWQQTGCSLMCPQRISKGCCDNLKLIFIVLKCCQYFFPPFEWQQTIITLTDWKHWGSKVRIRCWI